jgi:ubiquinone/menaquinone biosynthesis C-methylase UbiE
MSTQALYDQWSTIYDTVENKTRDLEKRACEKVLSAIEFETVLELGGGTGKNTGWLAKRAEKVISVELSERMQAVAKTKVQLTNVKFRLGDIRDEWTFVDEKVDLVTCSLILEHVEDLGPIFEKAAAILNRNGNFYVCELHPFKQYTGSKARFDLDGDTKVLDCYQHHMTDYTNAAFSAGFAVAKIDEWFDDDDRTQIPRLVSFLFTLNR